MSRLQRASLPAVLVLLVSGAGSGLAAHANEQRWGAPKAAGTIRVGVLTPSNTSGVDVSVDGIGNELLQALTVAPYEAVPLHASAKTGAFTWRRALGVAKLAARLYFGASTGMARMLLSQTGATGGGLPTGSADPSMSAVSFVVNLLDRGAEDPVDAMSREATVLAAVQAAAADIRESLGAKGVK